MNRQVYHGLWLLLWFVLIPFAIIGLTSGWAFNPFVWLALVMVICAVPIKILSRPWDDMFLMVLLTNNYIVTQVYLYLSKYG